MKDSNGRHLQMTCFSGAATGLNGRIPRFQPACETDQSRKSGKGCKRRSRPITSIVSGGVSGSGG